MARGDDHKIDLRDYPLTGRFLAGRMRTHMNAAEKATMESLIVETRDLEANQRIVHTGKLCNVSTMLIEGFMIRSLESEQGRHATSMHVPGDFVDLHCYALKRLDHNVDTLGPVKLGFVPHEAITRVMNEQPHLARLFWFSTLLDAAIHREWIMKLEQLTVPRRMAHIFAELQYRLVLVGIGQGDRLETPLTQSDLGDICGCSVVHANRAVAQLRSEGLADFQRGTVTIPSLPALHKYASFVPDYLYGPGKLSLSPDDLAGKTP